MILALPWALSVITPAWLPVNDRAACPRLAIAIATSAIEIRSPAVSSMSSSRGGGSGLTCWARSRSSSVVSPIADTTTTTSLPDFLVATIRWATRLIPAASATDEPPYFCTTMPTTLLSGWPAPRRGSGVLDPTDPAGVRRRGHRSQDGPDRKISGPDPSTSHRDQDLGTEQSRAASTWSCSPSNSVSSRSWATTECSALSTALARLPHEET